MTRGWAGIVAIAVGFNVGVVATPNIEASTFGTGISCEAGESKGTIVG